MHTVAEERSRLAGVDLAGRDASLSRALAQGLDTPLVALRATMESLGQEVLQGARPVAQLRIDGVLRELERLEKNVRALCAFASPPVPHPLPCSLEEIVSTARAGLTSDQRRRVIAARSTPGAHLEVDGPLLGDCLRRLIENALEASDDVVLVVARREPGQASLAVIDRGPSSLASDWQPLPFHTTKPNHLGLGLTLTRRDVELLNGRMECLSTPSGDTCVRITIPCLEDDR